MADSEPDICENCGRRIGKLEQPHEWRGHVVCLPCLEVLDRPAPPPPSATSSPATTGRLVATFTSGLHSGWRDRLPPTVPEVKYQPRTTDGDDDENQAKRDAHVKDAGEDEDDIDLGVGGAVEGDLTSARFELILDAVKRDRKGKANGKAAAGSRAEDDDEEDIILDGIPLPPEQLPDLFGPPEDSFAPPSAVWAAPPPLPAQVCAACGSELTFGQAVRQEDGSMLCPACAMSAASLVAPRAPRASRNSYTWVPWAVGAATVAVIVIVIAVVHVTGRTPEQPPTARPAPTAAAAAPRVADRAAPRSQPESATAPPARQQADAPAPAPEPEPAELTGDEPFAHLPKEPGSSSQRRPLIRPPAPVTAPATSPSAGR